MSDLKPAEEFLACLSLEGPVSMRPIDSERYVMRLTVSMKEQDGRTNPDDSPLGRCITASERAVLASLGFGGDYALSVLVGEHVGHVAVNLVETKAVLERHRFHVPGSYQELMHQVDKGFFRASADLEVEIVLARPRRDRVRQTTRSDME